ncbi:hypothetical protein PL321_10715 [Caloramator sp. mosi_1]|uniref:hypothetical protein n=1 Tax=Caloramator sp. mosi_1 TaxID=3023090 RepID=UPI00235E5BEA|nr:hypothetical protein [Caloramator sp. mosi_1]WDC83257.1 hypothetical protein PL321_10715 [Caloramator sp. mosi_1]
MLRHAVYVEEKGYIYKDEIEKDTLNKIVDLFNLEEKTTGDTYTYFKLDSKDYVLVKSLLIDEKMHFI